MRLDSYIYTESRQSRFACNQKREHPFGCSQIAFGENRAPDYTPLLSLESFLARDWSVTFS